MKEALNKNYFSVGGVNITGTTIVTAAVVYFLATK